MAKKTHIKDNKKGQSISKSKTKKIRNEIFSSTIIGKKLKNWKQTYSLEKLSRMKDIIQEAIITKNESNSSEIIGHIHEFINTIKTKNQSLLKTKKIIDSHLIEEIILTAKSSLTLKNILHEYQKFYPNFKCALSTLKKHLNEKMNYKYKSSSLVNLNSNYKESIAVILTFIEKICSIIEAKGLILFADESSFNDHFFRKKYWQPTNNKNIRYKAPRFNSVSVMASLSTVGIINYKITDTTFGSQDFFEFLIDLENELMKLEMFSKYLANNNVFLIVDNSRIHTSRVIRRRLKHLKINVLFQPIYMPEFNATELLWAKMKNLKKKITFTSK